MGLLGSRRNKKYDYEPRYYKGSESRKPFEIKHTFDEHRTTVERLNLKGKVLNALRDYREGSDLLVRRRLYIIIAILVFIFLWLIDFDLSIFKL